MCAAIAVREGLDERKGYWKESPSPLPETLAYLTGSAALKQNKDADLVLWTHHPFHFMAKPVLTFVNGEMAFSNL